MNEPPVSSNTTVVAGNQEADEVTVEDHVKRREAAEQNFEDKMREADQYYQLIEKSTNDLITRKQHQLQGQSDAALSQKVKQISFN